VHLHTRPYPLTRSVFIYSSAVSAKALLNVMTCIRGVSCNMMFITTALDDSLRNIYVRVQLPSPYRFMHIETFEVVYFLSLCI
jgi:hypothetical protein